MPNPSDLHDFEADIAVTPMGEGRYQASIHRHWWIMVGPNGGLLIAQLAHAIETELADASRQLRTITVHFLRPPTEGSVEIHVEPLRVGRSVATVRATMSQDAKLIATALSASSPAWPSEVRFNRQPLPEVADARGLDRREVATGLAPPVVANYDMRMLSDYQDGEPLVRAWLRTAKPRPVDALSLVAFSDALPPPVFAMTQEPMAVPTLELTVHIRASLPHAGLADDDLVLMEASSSLLADGFVEEDTRIWAPDGTLLAQSRQLALAR